MTATEANEGSAAQTDWRTVGLDELRAAMPGVIPEGDVDMHDGKIGDELVELSLITHWGMLWSREGLSRRDRSLLTLGMLIALGTESELKTHVRVGLNNGLTRDEVAEVIYHAVGYVGGPRAAAARTAIREALGE